MVEDLRSQLNSILSQTPGTVAVTVETPGWCFRRLDVEPFASASLIKVPILLAALTSGRGGQVDLDTPLPLEGKRVGGGGLVEFFDRRSSLTLRDLLVCMIAISDNTATNRVIEMVGYAMVNGVLASLGLRDTQLRREMMDLQARAQGRENVTTASDMHNLLTEILHPKRLDPEVAAEALTFLQRQQLPQGLGFFLPEGSFDHKTGELEGVFHDVGILWPHGPQPVIMTFLSKDVPSVPEAQITAGRIGRLVYDNVMESCR